MLGTQLALIVGELKWIVSRNVSTMHPASIKVTIAALLLPPTPQTLIDPHLPVLSVN
jgi:hypothetical protein